jgi:hypothetical protein
LKILLIIKRLFLGNQNIFKENMKQKRKRVAKAAADEEGLTEEQL